MGILAENALNFSSLQFIFRILPIFLLAYYVTPKKGRNLILLLGSILFYTMAQPGGLLLLVLSALINYGIARKIGSAGNDLGKESLTGPQPALDRAEAAAQGGAAQPQPLLAKAQETQPASQVIREEAAQQETRPATKPSDRFRNKRKAWLLLALVYNFGMLLLYKYVGPAGAMPLGMSFYTFRIVSYVLDVYEMQIDAEHSLLRLGTYLCMFPAVVSGPVTRYDPIRLQLSDRIHSAELFEDGLKTFVLGLASKLVLADRIAILWHEVQTIGFAGISTPLAWMGAFAYTFQIYFDFQGYSLMAIGVGKMLGFHLPDNFRQPYAARSFGEFWRRWHITLGEWFRDYVYIPLGGNRKGTARTCANLLLVWLLTGMWHGSTVNFLLWGIFVGLLLVTERLFLRRFLDKSKVFSHLYMFIMIPLTWVVFAIPDLKQLGLYFSRLFPLTGGAAGINPDDYLKYAGMFGGIFALCLLFCLPALGRWYQRHRKHPLVILFLAAAFWAAVYYGANSVNNPFVYLNF